MNDLQDTDVPSKELMFPNGLEVSWAGAHPFQPGFCLGTEDGVLHLFDREFKSVGPPFNASNSREAINSVVACANWIVTSTRQTVTFIAKEASNGQRVTHELPFGAHNLAVSDGFVVASLGPLGLMFARPILNADGLFNLGATAANIGLNVYRVVALPSSRILVAAARAGGLVFGKLKPPEVDMKVLSFPGLDVVDVCPIGTPQFSQAIAAVAKDGTLVLSKDILHDAHPRTMKFENVQGVTYRILSDRGHLFVLTNKVLYGLTGFAERFLNGTLNGKKDCRILALPMTAIDMSLVQNELVIVELDRIVRINSDVLSSSNIKAKSETPREYTPAWKSTEVTPTRSVVDMRSILAAV
jgi:hypothetical protein